MKKNLYRWGQKILAEFLLGMSCLLLVGCAGKSADALDATILQAEPISTEVTVTSKAEVEVSEDAVEEVYDQEPLAEWANSIEFDTAYREDREYVVQEKKNLIYDLGDTLETRVLTPDGYARTEVEEGGFEEFLRQYHMKPAGSKVHLYDGTEKADQSAHVAVFDLPIEDYDLQQCADSVMRMYAEYFWATEQYDRIKFHFTNGSLVEYEKWRDGNRVTINGNSVSWLKSKSKDTSYECFVRYLRTIFCYAGTLSMEKESEPTLLSLLKAGDVFLYGGNPGHVVMVVDVCENEQGKKAFLLAQGYMPAQEFHLLKNERHSEDPWYYESEITYPFSTPEYTFEEGCLRSLNY